jgi:hypothetical protein
VAFAWPISEKKGIALAAMETIPINRLPVLNALSAIVKRLKQISPDSAMNVRNIPVSA